MKASHVGVIARTGWMATLLGLAAIGLSPTARAQDSEPAADDEVPADAPPPSEEPEESPSEASEPDAAVADEAAPVGNPEWHSPLRVLVGARLMSRSFRYTDALSDVSPAARAPVGYPGFAVPMPRAEVRWYPAGHFTQGWVSQLGVVAGYEIAVGQSLSYDADGDGLAETAIGETHDLWYAGARGRIPIGNVAFGLQVDYGMHRSSLSGDEDAVTGLPVFPDVNYGQVEIGADFEWRIEQMIVGLHGSYNIVLDVGQIGQDINPDAATVPWFPGTQGTAVDFGAYVGWRLSRVFDVLVGVDMRAYGLDFGTVPPGTDPSAVVIAGGATDRYLSAWLGLAVKLPVKGDAEAAAGAASAGEADSAEGADGFDNFD